MITVREATSADVTAITGIFQACYGSDYPDSRYYNAGDLTKLISSDDTLVLVAEEAETAKVLGTASVLLEVGAYADLTGEFGRLAVAPEARHRGIATLLTQERLRRTQGRLQLAIIEARTADPFSQRIAEAQDFTPVGFLPHKWPLRQRESLILLARYFSGSLELRKNHPRLIPEAYPLACLALESCGVKPDAIADEESPAYAAADGFALQELTTEGYATLLRIERGRVRRREIFGPLRLHYGFFLLQAQHSRYLIARRQGAIAGAIGFIFNATEQVVRVFELISLQDEVIPFLISELERLCRQEWHIKYIEIDVSADAPRMQRTLLESGFLPAAYVPALVFHEVERLDAIKMARLLVPLEVKAESLTPRANRVAETVLRPFRSRNVIPRIAEVARTMPLFGGLNAEQLNRLASLCNVCAFEPNDLLFREGEKDDRLYVVLEGEVEITVEGISGRVGVTKAGECLGEMSLLTVAPHSATARTRSFVETAVLKRDDIAQVIRMRPDIGAQIYKNLAVGLGEKLNRTDRSLPRN